jgi:hypothetical protein
MKPEKFLREIKYRGHRIRFYRVGDNTDYQIEIDIDSARLRMVDYKPQSWPTIDAASRAAIKFINNGITETMGMG